MNKKALYESIMRNVAKEVKRALNESDANDEIVLTRNGGAIHISKEEYEVGRQIADALNGKVIDADREPQKRQSVTINIGNVAAVIDSLIN